MFCFFFFQAEDGIRDKLVTGVQTCALPAPGAAMDSTAIAGKVVFLLIERGPTPLARQVARLHAAAIVGISPIPDSIWTVIAGRQSGVVTRSEEHTSELQSLAYLVCRLL